MQLRLQPPAPARGATPGCPVPKDRRGEPVTGTSAEGLIEVSDEVGDVLQTDGDPDQVGGDLQG